MIKEMGVKPENVVVMALEKDFKKIVTRFKPIDESSEPQNNYYEPQGQEETKDTQNYYEDAPNDEHAKEWRSKPARNIPEFLLPTIKTKYLCYARAVTDETLTLLSERANPKTMRADPTLEVYAKVMQKFVGISKAFPQKNYLFI